MKAPVSSSSSPSRRLLWSGVIFSLVFPTIGTWAYFVQAEHYPPMVQQVTYLIFKAIQFSFPLIWVWMVLREPARIRRPAASGLLLGMGFGLVVVAGGWLMFDRMLRHAAAFSAAAGLIHEKIGAFGIDSAWKYFGLAAAYSIGHSFLEEYYWRWFAFRQLRRLVPLWPAIGVSAAAFMGHHVVVLGTYFAETPWLAGLLSLGVAVGGVFWAWLYERTGSLFGPWLSHLVIDAGIFWIGYDLVRESFAR